MLRHKKYINYVIKFWFVSFKLMQEHKKLLRVFNNGYTIKQLEQMNDEFSTVEKDKVDMIQIKNNFTKRISG